MIKKAILWITVFVIISLTFNTLNLTPVIGQFFASIIGNEKTVYSPDPESLTSPTLIDYEHNVSPAPNPKATLPPGFGIESKYTHDAFYRNSSDVIRLEISNNGENAIFIYGYGTETSNGTSHSDSGYLIGAGKSQELGLVTVEIPPGDQFSITPYVYLMAQSDSGKWYDYGMQTFDMLDFTTAVTPKEKTNTYHTNPQYYFNRVNDIVNTTDPLVRNTAVSNAREHPGKYNAYQLCSLFDYVSNSVEYVSDPHDSDYWATPAETITTGAGDCEDYAILMAALVEAIGGSARIYLTDDHAFAAAYIGESNATDKTIEAISEYYNYAPVYYVTDIYGSWIMLDASSGMYAGDLPAGAAPVSGGWIFLNQTNVTVVDIASD